MSDPRPNPNDIEELPDDPRDVASAARSCLVILLLAAAIMVVLGLYFLAGWVF